MSVLFISDLHLDARRPAITRLFLNFLAGPARQARALYILGDLFEAWIGDDDPDPEFQQVISALKDCVQSGVPVSIMHGNRDFLLGEGFTRQSGCHLLTDPTLIDLDGEKVLLMHGDTLCTDDTEYQQFRSLVRDSGWQQEFLAKPIDERRQIAAQLRKASREKTQEKAGDIMDVNPDAVSGCFREHRVNTLIHGHTHRPAMHSLQVDGHEVRRLVLGDWYTQGSVLSYEQGEFELQALPIDTP